MFQTTLCYLERGNCYLMLHRIRKKDDENAGKWIGIGGHFEHKESPEECVARETFEETGISLPPDAFRLRGIITFVYDENPTEYIYLFTAFSPTDELQSCSEGELAWIPKDQLHRLPQWEGDRVFLDLLKKDEPFFSLKLVYENDRLTETYLNGAYYC